MSAIEEAVLSEFGAYYQGDALPAPGHLDAAVPVLAKGSAYRLKRAVGPEGLAELVRVLGELHDDPAHPLHGHIMNRTEIYWPDVAEMWASFQRLMELTIAELGAPVTADSSA